MHPILVQFGRFPIHTFGVLMGAGFLVGILYSLREARRAGLDPDGIFNLCFWIMVTGVLGARVLYMILDVVQKGRGSEFFSINPLKLFALWEGGLVWYGGFIPAAAFVFAYTWKKGMPVWRTADMLTPATFMGLALGRIGCLMAGDDFGKLMPNFPLAVVFRDPGALVYPDSWRGKPLFPSQIHMSVDAFLVALVGHLVLRRSRFQGQAFSISIMLYAVLRGIEEIYRGDEDRGFIGHTPLTTSQGIGIGVFAVGAFLYWKRRAAGSPAPLLPPPPELRHPLV